LLGGAIASGANGLSVLLADPVNFNLTTSGGISKVLFVMAVSAAVGAALYLKNHPLPDEDADGVALPLCPSCARPVSTHEEHA
jgi:hypothetical protein